LRERGSGEGANFFSGVADDGITELYAEVTEMGELESGAGEIVVRHERRRVALEGMADRRRHPRYAVDAWAEVMVKDGRMLFRGRVLDISARGCYIETEARLRLAPGTAVDMVFRVNDAVFRYDASIRMIRTKGAGFLFANLDERLRADLERLIGTLHKS
jgi:PilZ domain